VVSALLALAGLGLVARLVQVQLVDHDRLARLADRHQFRREQLQPERGRIYDRNHVLLGYSVESPSIYAVRDKIEDRAEALGALAELGISRSHAASRLTGKKGFVWIDRGLHREARTRELLGAVAGLHYRLEPKRVYPRGAIARTIIGRHSDDPDLLSGMEGRYNDILLGECGWQTVIMDALGGRYATAERRPARPGQNLVLTLDSRVQEIAELVLDEGIERWQAIGGVVLVLEPRSGDVLAMASRRRTDSGLTASSSAITDPFEMGSCAKLFVASAALEDGICDTTTAFYCGVMPGEEDPPVVHDDHGDEEWLSFQMVIAESRNVGTARIARLVGEERLYKFLTRYGFGRRSGIELTGESAGLLRKVDAWSGRSLETLAIGYEFSATALQLGMAYSAIANGGLLLSPRVVSAVEDPVTGESNRRKREVVRRVIDDDTARTLRAILHRGTQVGGTGVKADVRWTDVAGKTGTARKFDHELGRYTPARHVASFAGFVPWKEPQFVCVVMIDEPKGAYYASEVAAPIFSEMVDKIAAVYPTGLRRDVREIECELPRSIRFAERTETLERGVPDLRGLATLAARRRAAEAGYRTEVLGTGERVLFQSPPPGSPDCPVVMLSTAGEVPEQITIPGVEGLGLREAMARLGALGLYVTPVGRGTVVRQVPGAGAVVPSGSDVELVLSDRKRSWGTWERS